MSPTAPAVSSGHYLSSSRVEWLSAQKWRALALNQQRLRWVECGRRVSARMKSVGYLDVLESGSPNE